MTRKILYSSGFGAGWTTWNNKGKEFLLTYQPIIEYLETGQCLDDENPILKKLAREYKEKYGEEPYLDAASSLEVVEVEGRVFIYECDGNEDYIEENSDSPEWL